MKYGARHLKRAIERHIVYPLANLLATEQVRLGDVLCIDYDESRQVLLFEREGEGAVLPVPLPRSRRPARMPPEPAGAPPSSLRSPPLANCPRRRRFLWRRCPRRPAAARTNRDRVRPALDVTFQRHSMRTSARAFHVGVRPRRAATRVVVAAGRGRWCWRRADALCRAHRTQAGLEHVLADRHSVGKEAERRRAAELRTIAWMTPDRLASGLAFAPGLQISLQSVNDVDQRICVAGRDDYEPCHHRAADSEAQLA